jgi:hypothetical protein
LKKTRGSDGFPNECLTQFPRRPLVHLIHLIIHCIRLSHFLTSWKEAKVVALPKPGKDPKFPQNLLRICRLPSTGKVFESYFGHCPKMSEEETCLMQISLASVRVSTTLQCMRLADHVILMFNNKMSTASVFLDIGKTLTLRGTLACSISYLN